MNYDEHYIDSVTALGDTHEVVASQAVFTRNGIKLIERGTRINSTFREKLLQHKLLPPIDQCLVVAGGVAEAALRERAREILDAEPRFQLLRTALPGIERLLNAFYAMPLAPALAFKLTVAREQRPEIYEHSVQMTLIALFLAIRSRLPDCDLAAVAAAGMLHDLGELDVDPELLRPGRRLEAGPPRPYPPLLGPTYRAQRVRVSNSRPPSFRRSSVRPLLGLKRTAAWRCNRQIVAGRR